MAASSRDPGPSENRGPDGDVDLMRRARAGDAHAFSLLYAQHYQTVVGFLHKRGKISSAPEMMAQEVFLRAWKDRERFDGQASAKTYLLAIARHVWLQSTAVEVREASVVETFRGPRSHGCHYCGDKCRLAEPEASHCQQERGAVLARHIAGLPRTSREAVEAVLQRGLNAKQAAAEAGCSERTLSKRVERAIAFLRASLGGGDGAP